MRWLLLFLLPALAFADDRTDLAELLPRAAQGQLTVADHARLASQGSDGEYGFEVEALRGLDALVRNDVDRHCAAATAMLTLRDDADTRLEAARCALLSGRADQVEVHLVVALSVVEQLSPAVVAGRRLLAYRLRALASSALATDSPTALAAAGHWRGVAGVAGGELATAAALEADKLTAWANDGEFYRPTRALREELPKDLGDLLARLTADGPAPPPAPATAEPVDDFADAVPEEPIDEPAPEEAAVDAPPAAPAPPDDGPPDDDASASSAEPAPEDPAVEAAPADDAVAAAPEPPPPPAEPPPPAGPAGFREASWGDSRRTIGKTETRDPRSRDGDRVVYEDGLLGQPVGVVYRFDVDDLYEGAYVFDARSNRRAPEVLQQYRDLFDSLVTKYGDPVGDDERWARADLRERGVEKAQALEYGDLAFEARWEFPATVIRLRLRNRDGRLTLQLVYTQASRAPAPEPKARARDLDKL